MTEIAPPKRLPGSLIDATRTVGFRFEGHDYKGCSGDCIASALAANGQWILSRSFKYHRPRGVLTMAGQDANTLVQRPADPNALADRVPVEEGMDVLGQNYSGSLLRDRNRVIGYLARFLPVGFYYRAFYRPRGIWNLWARLFRRQAGLGVIDEHFVPPKFDKQYLFCDVLVVGGGPAGMAAACHAAQAGRKVVLVDENPVLGGSLNYARFSVDLSEANNQRAELVAAIKSNANIRVLTEAIANGWFSDNWVPIVQGKRMYKLRANQVVLCPGGLEQHAVFRNNDLPGVMLGGAAQRLLRLYGVRPGQRAVVLTGNDQGYGVALDLLDAGTEVVAVVEMRVTRPTSALADEVVSRGIDIRLGQTIYAANGRDHLCSVDVRRIVAQGKCSKDGETLACDLLCVSVGFTPSYQLACQAGARLNYDDDSALFEIVDLPPAVTIAGAANGHWDLQQALHDGRAAAGTGERTQPPANSSPNYPWPIFAHPKGKEFVDFDEDLQIADIVNAVHDGYEHVQLVKRFSTCGMGPSQGRHSALPMARLVARETGSTVAKTGVTTARPPFAAETLGHCAGRSFYPTRRSSMHYRHCEVGAQWLQAGDWYRPAYYGTPENRSASIRAEAARVRNGVGMVDISTLGGIDIRGPDAGEFINRLYTMLFSTLDIGRARYALMLNEAGVVIDDGVACRLADDLFYVTATTGGVDRIYLAMLKWQAQWRLDLDIANVTSAWCGLNVAGPKSRDVLAAVCDDVDLTAKAFGYMAVREGNIGNIPARVIRVGFVGELGYEIHVPQHYGCALWDVLLEAGSKFGLQPFGIEAQRLLRLEKGHLIVGQDTDAMSNPMELGMQWALSKKKRFYVGKRTLAELGARPLKRQLVGFVIKDPAAPIPNESHLVVAGGEMVGRVTSAEFSPCLGYTVGLAYVPPHSAEPGSKITIRCAGGATVTADVAATPFYDAANARQAL